MNYLDYFKTERDMYVFALTCGNGKLRSRLLGISERLYYNEWRAREWRDRILGVITDGGVIQDDNTREAIQKLNWLYNNMTM